MLHVSIKKTLSQGNILGIRKEDCWWEVVAYESGSSVLLLMIFVFSLQHNVPTVHLYMYCLDSLISNHSKDQDHPDWLTSKYSM